MQGVLNVVWAKLLPALQAKTSGALATDAAGQEKLRARLAALALKLPSMIDAPALAKTVAGKKYVFPKNPQAIEAMVLSMAVCRRLGLARSTLLAFATFTTPVAAASTVGKRSAR